MISASRDVPEGRKGRIEKFVSWSLGPLPGQVPFESRELGVSRLIFTAVAFANIPLALIMMYSELDQDYGLRQPIQLLGFVLCVGCYSAARFGQYGINLPRILFGYIFFISLFQIYHDYELDSLIYLIMVPLLSHLLFGQREGFVWSMLVFCFAVPAALDWGIKYFAMSYLGMTMLALLLEGIRERAERESIKYREESEAEHQRLMKAQADLEGSEARFRTYSELASDWLFEMDKNLTYTFATPRLYEILGGTIEGNNLSNLSIELEGDGSALEPMRRGEEVINQQVSFKNYNGQRVVALFSAKPLHDENGEFAGYIGAGKDITTIKQAEEELRVKDQTLHHMQKLEALGQLTSGVAHDFNNLLTIIGGNLDLLDQTLNESERAMMQASLRAVDRAGELTQQLLSFSRKQELDPKSVHIDAVFERLNLMFGRTMEGGVKIDISVPENIWACHADEGQLENAILNLALNARDAMAGRGSLTMGAENFHQAKTDSHLAAGDYVRIFVSDTGTGISEAELSRIMEPFYTTKPVGQGTGLGLSMVYGFARQSSGTLDATSEVGIGSTFSLFLPRSLEAPGDGRFEPVDADQLAGKVMVIDDDPEVLNVIQMGLEKMGLDVSEFNTAEQALLNIDSVAPELIISDLMLGEGINGAEFANQVMSHHPTIPILLISGNPDQLLSDDDYRRHSLNLLRKPFSYQKLREAVQTRLQMS